MNKWIELSIEYANQRSYLDDLFQVYPTIPDGIRNIDNNLWSEVEKSFKNKDNDRLIRLLLNFDLFPIKDSYIAYLKRDRTAIERNPRTINSKGVKAEKIAVLDGVLFIKGKNKMYKAITEEYNNYNIMSALVLRNFLYQL